MPPIRVWLLTALAMLAFTGNSVLCRAALQYTQIDPASFTAIRLVSGVAVLLLIIGMRRENLVRHALRAGT
jgi:hypothetical protein